MFTLVRCPACGGDWAESDVRCPACGFEDAAEDVVASWVSDPVVETAWADRRRGRLPGVRIRGAA